MAEGLCSSSYIYTYHKKVLVLCLQARETMPARQVSLYIIASSYWIPHVALCRSLLNCSIFTEDLSSIVCFHYHHV